VKEGVGHFDAFDLCYGAELVYIEAGMVVKSGFG
jgi:hypothetical protein